MRNIRRSIWVADDLWKRAVMAAIARDLSTSQLVRIALRAYLAGRKR